MTAVLYHEHCADGFCAAWLHRRLAPQLFPGSHPTEYVAVQHGDEPSITVFGWFISAAPGSCSARAATTVWR